MQRKNLKIALCAVACSCVIGAGSIGSYAYFTDSSSKLNTFTVSHLDISLTEPNYTALSDSNSDGIKDLATNMVQGKTTKADPTIVNNSTIGAYAIMVVDIPIRNVMTVSSAPSRETIELFSYVANSGWTLRSTKNLDGYVRRVYTYNSIVDVGKKTTPLFDTVTYADVVEGQISDTLSIPIKGYAIQAKAFSSVDDAYANFDWNQ